MRVRNSDEQEKTGARWAAGAIARFVPALVAIAAALFATVSLDAPRTLAAASTQICFAVDGSGSIVPANFTLEKGAIAAAVEDPTQVPHDGSVELTVLQFDSIVKVPAVPPTVVTAANASPAGSSTLGNAIRGMVQSGGGTAIGDAITGCAGHMNGSPKAATATLRAINVATNGDSNTGQTVAAASAAVQAAGIDRLDFEAFGTSPNIAVLLAAAFPQPSEKVAPGGVPVGPQPRGFVMNITDFGDFSTAIRVKLSTLIGNGRLVGGVLVDPDRDAMALEGSNSSGTDVTVLLLAFVTAGVAASVALGGGVWLARRRWLK